MNQHRAGWKRLHAARRWSVAVPYWRGLLLVLLSALLPAGAGQAAESSHDTTLRPVTLQLKWRHQFQFAGYYAAIEQGYYRAAGLDVSVEEYVPGSPPVDKLLGGRVDFAVSDTGALLYRANGSPLVALAAIFQYSPSVLISLDRAGIATLQQLRNRRVMLGGGFMNAELMAMLGTAGLGSSDFTLVPSETSIDVLLAGGVEAYNGYTTNEVFRLEQDGIAHRVFQPSDYGVDFYGDILLTTEALVEAEPELVARFRAASIRGWMYAVEQPEAVVDLILRRYNTQQKSREHLLFEARETLKLVLSNVVPIGYMSAERWQNIARVFREQGLMQRDVNLEGFLYVENPQPGLLAVLRTYRVELTLLGVLVVGLFLLLHIISLRRVLRLRTRDMQVAMLQAEAEARTDALTGMPNRRYFFESLEREVARAKRYQLPLALMSIDIDHFKPINDHHGHAIGDEALRRVAAIFLAHCRTGDMAARIGGEEFAIACFNTVQKDCEALAERLRCAVQGMELAGRDGVFHMTISVGIGLLTEQDTVASLLQKSDEALYTAKKTGRNRVCVYPQTQ